ncbi:response regulator [Eubacterium oxidoreducens]|uniref:Stage 0 sporulation protein A homolog n=1 Tax=Eubacterium oxidoreducens TaxID=1732 RepID=A0A1G6CPW0_EUBOX|nr:response regulator transcription factor [Eubacterium oxidoreducens]SDB34923.1 two component transcriptional regulator, LuxR family [Eubacterium oxidoreducens]
MIKLMLTDDHAMVREGLKNLLELEENFDVVAEASDGLECLNILKDGNTADVLLLDINMPNMNGLEVLEQLKKLKVDIKVIILTVHNEVEYLLKAVEVGIDGYILKDSDLSVLKTAINSVYNGEAYIQPDLIPSLNAKLVTKNADQELIDSLTKRELEVLKKMAVGLFNKDIAEQLNISERTVKNHISNIFKKIKVVDRTQAAVFAIRNNLINVF